MSGLNVRFDLAFLLLLSFVQYGHVRHSSDKIAN